jgi:hypothetical protein
MRSLTLPALLLGLGLAGLALPLPAAAPPSDPGATARLVAQLGSAEYAEREAATEALAAIGEVALPALRKAAASPDMEVRMRAGRLLAQIERQAEQARILAPRRVHLAYKNVAVAEAVADLRAKSGYHVVLHVLGNTLRDRKVTLDTGGPVPFWEALDLFCAKAGLAEGQPTAFPVGGPPSSTVRRLPAVPPGGRVGGRRGIGVGPGGPGGGLPFVQQAPGQITLVDQKLVLGPTDARTAVRIRAAGGMARGREVLLTLQVTPEPKLRWQQLLAVKITKAVDDKGQSLREPMPAVPGTGVGAPGIPGGPGAPGGPPVAVWGGKPGYYPPQQAGLQHVSVTAQLVRGAAPAKALKELSGVVSAEVLSEPEVLLVADDVLKAKGKTFVRPFRGDEAARAGRESTLPPGLRRLSPPTSRPPAVVPIFPPRTKPSDRLARRTHVLCVRYGRARALGPGRDEN